ncbi:hypothetical protein S83_023153, partial [Arachis hypogaea]
CCVEDIQCFAGESHQAPLEIIGRPGLGRGQSSISHQGIYEHKGIHHLPGDGGQARLPTRSKIFKSGSFSNTPPMPPSFHLIVHLIFDHRLATTSIT